MEKKSPLRPSESTLWAMEPQPNTMSTRVPVGNNNHHSVLPPVLPTCTLSQELPQVGVGHSEGATAASSLLEIVVHGCCCSWVVWSWAGWFSPGDPASHPPASLQGEAGPPLEIKLQLYRIELIYFSCPARGTLENKSSRKVHLFERGALFLYFLMTPF